MVLVSPERNQFLRHELAASHIAILSREPPPPHYSEVETDMANSVLFKSSVAMAVLHVLGLLWCSRPNPLLATNVVVGVGTSIWNHGVTSFTAKIADRVMMWLGFFVDLHLALTVSHHLRCLLCVATLVGASVLYWISKMWIAWSATTRIADLSKGLKTTSVKQARLGNVPHLCAHLSLTVTHLLLMEALAA